MLDVDHLVGEGDGRAPVGHDHDGDPGRVPQAVEDLPLHGRVDGTGGVVQDEDPGPADQRAGDGQALALPTGQARPALPHPRVQALGQGGHEGLGAGGAQSRPHLVVADGERAVLQAEGDVAPHGVVEHERGLRDVGDRGRQTAGHHVPQVGAVHRDATGDGVHETDQQRGQRGLPRPRRPDHGHRRARRGVHVDAVQQPLGAAVGVDDVVGHARHDDVATLAGGREVAVAVLHPARGVQHRTHTAPADRGPRQLGQHPPDGPDGEREQGELVGHLDHRARLDRARADPDRADREHDQRAEGGQRLDDGLEDGPGAADGDVGVAQLAGAGGEPLGLLGLPAEGLDHERTLEGLMGHVGDVGPQLLGPADARRHGPLVEAVGHDQQRQHRERDRRQHGVGGEHGHPGHQEHDDHAEAERQRREDPERGLHVGVGVAEQLSGGVAVVPGQRQAQVLSADGTPVAGLQPVLGDGRVATTDDDAQRGQDADHGHRPRGGPRLPGPDLAPLERRDEHPVGHLAQHPAAAGQGRPEHRRADDGEGEGAWLVADAPHDDADPLAEHGVIRHLP